MTIQNVTCFSLTLWLLSQSAAFALDDPLPLLESIKNSDVVTIVRARKRTKITAGTELHYGEMLITNEGTALVRYPDQSLVTIGPQSAFTLEPPTPTTQWSRLHRGAVRGLITKSKAVLSRPKFVIRTRAAVLGVRGTDFVMALSQSGTAQVHTLEGVVDVAQNEIALLSGKGTSIAQGQFIESAGSSLSPVQSFNREAFLHSLENSGLSSATPAASSGAGATASSSALAGSAQPLSSLAQASGPASAPSLGQSPLTQGMGSGSLANRAVEQGASALNQAPGASGLPGSPVSSFPLSSGPPSPGPLSPSGPGVSPDGVLQADPPGFKLFAFQTGVLFTELSDGRFVRAISAALTPNLQLPWFTFLSIRGHVGVHFTQDEASGFNLMASEFQGFVTFVPMDLIFAEAGIGKQIWHSIQVADATLSSLRAGLRVELGPMDRIFAGVDWLETPARQVQYRVGIHLSL